MSFTDKQKKSWNCQRCGFEMVEIEKDTIEKIIGILNPDFLSIPKDWQSKKAKWLKICPQCDSYPLGLVTKHKFPIRTKTGNTTTINELDFVKAHKHHYFRDEILVSEICGCFYCLETFSPEEITEWRGVDENGVEQIAVCPKCNFDSVIGDKSEYPIAPNFLKKMHDFWFSTSEWSKIIRE